MRVLEHPKELQMEPVKEKHQSYMQMLSHSKNMQGLQAWVQRHAIEPEERKTPRLNP